MFRIAGGSDALSLVRPAASPVAMALSAGLLAIPAKAASQRQFGRRAPESRRLGRMRGEMVGRSASSLARAASSEGY